MKRILALLLALSVVLCFAACKQNAVPGNTQTQPGNTDETLPTTGNENAGVERKNVYVLSGITAKKADGSKSYEYTWETLDRRIINTLTASVAGKETKLNFNYREGERAGTVTGLPSDVTIDFAWDELGRIVSMTEESPGGTYAVMYTYDDENRCTGKSISRNGSVASDVAYVYEADKLVKEAVTLADGSLSNEKTYTYNEHGDLSQEVTKYTGSDTVVNKYSYAYNDAGQMLSKDAFSADDIKTKYTYTYDADGRVLTETAFQGDVRTAHTEYGYNERGELVKEQKFLAGENTAQTVEYAYTEVRMSDMEYELYQMLQDFSRGWC